MGTAGAVVAGGAVAGLIGGNQAAKGAERSARAQLASAHETLNFAKKTQQKAFDAAAAGPEELRAYEQSLAAQEKNVAAEARLLASIDPQLIEASNQALKLLRGEEAGVTTAAKNQRDRQRKQLLDSLREQLGPGAETSSIGRQALRQFDLESQDLVAGQQQSALQTLFSGQTGLGQVVGQTRGLAAQRLGAAGQNFGNVSQRQSNALVNTLGAVTGAGTQVAQASGASAIGSTLQGQTLQGVGAGLVQGGLSAMFPAAEKKKAAAG